MNKSQWYERRKTTDVVARNYYSNLSQKEERDQGTENWGEQREAGFLVCECNANARNEEQDICSMYRNKINNKTSRGTTHGLAGYCKDPDNMTSINAHACDVRLRGRKWVPSCVNERALEPSLAHAAHRLQRVFVNRSPPRMSVSSIRILHLHLLPHVPSNATPCTRKRTGGACAPRGRQAFAHMRRATAADADADRRTAVMRVAIGMFGIAVAAGRLGLLDDADGFTAELRFFEVHQFRDETDVGRYAFASLEDECVGA
jgi:hypothetical protein